MVQVKVTADAHNLKKIDYWTEIVTHEKILPGGNSIASSTSSYADRLSSCRFMFDLSSSSMDEAAGALAKHLYAKKGEQGLLEFESDYKEHILNNGLIIGIE